MIYQGTLTCEQEDQEQNHERYIFKILEGAYVRYNNIYYCNQKERLSQLILTDSVHSLFQMQPVHSCHITDVLVFVFVYYMNTHSLLNS